MKTYYECSDKELTERLLGMISNLDNGIPVRLKHDPGRSHEQTSNLQNRMSTLAGKAFAKTLCFTPVVDTQNLLYDVSHSNA